VLILTLRSLYFLHAPVNRTPLKAQSSSFGGAATIRHAGCDIACILSVGACIGRRQAFLNADSKRGGKMTPTSSDRAKDAVRPTLLCFSHLRWNFVYQRPQHLMTRFARDYQVLFIEELVPSPGTDSWLEVRDECEGVRVLVPRLAPGLT